MEDLRQMLVIPCLRRLHDPSRRVDKLSKINLAATGHPFTLDASGDHQRIIEKGFDIQVVRRMLLGR